MVAPFSQFVQIANFFYATIGIQPYEDSERHTSKIRDNIRQWVFYVGVINLNFHFFGELAFIANAFYRNAYFLEATVTAAYVGFVAVADCKMLSIWRKKDELSRLISNLRKIYPATLAMQESYKLKVYLGHVTIVMVLFASLYMFLIWTYNLFNLIQYEIYRHWDAGTEQFLAYFIYLPWDWHGTMWYYWLTLSQIGAGYVSAAGIISSDLLLCAIATQVCMHYDYIGRQIEEFKPAGGREDLQFLNGMIKYHKKVLNLSDSVNDAFGVPLLFNFATSSFIICFVGFQMTTGVSSEELFKYMLFLLSSVSQVYLICYYGQRTATSSEHIAMCLYNQIWYMNTNTPYRRSLIIMMNRAQKPARLNATIFLNISLRTFTEIVQLSYKFFTLLRTMYAK